MPQRIDITGISESRITASATDPQKCSPYQIAAARCKNDEIRVQRFGAREDSRCCRTCGDNHVRVTQLGQMSGQKTGRASGERPHEAFSGT